MSFISGLFGGGDEAAKQFTPRATPAAPRISDSASESAVREERKRLNYLDEDETILAGLGSVGGSSPSASVKRATLLGGV